MMFRSCTSAGMTIAMIAAIMAITVGGTSPASAVSGDTSPIFINEFHYDNTGADTGEFVEVAGPAGTDLTGWQIVLYNGSGGASYDTENLTGFIDDEGTGTGALSFTPGSLQNGPDAIALVNGGTLVQFLSYEGTFTATNGPASGQTSTLVGSESASTPIGQSLQVTGTGTQAGDFTWGGPSAESPGSLNTGQTLTVGSGSGPTAPLINEFSMNTTGDDVEYFEIIGDPSTDYSAFSVLEIQGKVEGSDDPGDVIEVFPVGTTDANGFYLVSLTANTIENDPITLLLVEDFTGAAGDDLDPGDDGTFDTTPWSSLADDVSIQYSTGVPYSTTVLDEAFDDATYTSTFAPGGASRIPDGTDTDTAADWVRNDFDLAGISGEPGTPEAGEALNTPGATNALIPPSIVINEIMQDPLAAGDSEGEFVELYNFGTTDIDIDGWTIADNGSNSHVINNGGPLVVPAGRFLVLGIDDDFVVNGGVFVDYVYSSFGLSNGDDEVILIDDTATEVDRVEWDGGPTFPDPTGASMALRDPFLNNNAGINWCTSVTVFGDGDLGTPGEINDCPPITGGTTLISAIQGSVVAPDPDVPTGFPAAGDTADDSPLLGQIVTISGIVTGWDDLAGQSNSGAIFHSDRGFFVQEEDADADGDPTTSEGIYVQFAAATDDVANFQPGDLVQVTGEVAEHFEFTVIAAGNTASVISSGNPLPIPVTIDPLTIDRDGWEAVEGQLVLVEDAVANSGGTNRFNELVLTPGTTQDILVRPQTHPGLFGLVADAGADNPLLPRKPDAPSTTVVKADLFDTIEDATGPVGYSFDIYKIFPQPGALPTVNQTGITYPFAGVSPATAGQVRVTALNVENFFPVGVSHDGAPVTTQEYLNKRDRIVDAIDDQLQRPDIVGVEEVDNLTILQDVATELGGYTAHLIEGNDNRGIDVGFLTKNTVTVNSVTQLGATAPDPTSDNCGDIAGLLFDRPPLAIDTTVNGIDLVVINNHFSSKGAPDSCRDAQSTFLRDQVALLETAGKNVVVTGDLNAFEDETPLGILEDGTTTLDNLWDTVAVDDAYSFQFSGILQTLDHMLITDGLLAYNPTVQYAHFNTAYYSRQLDEASLLTPFDDGHKGSDHDPPVLTLSADAGLAALDDPCAVYDSPTATDTALDGSFAAGESRTVQVTGALTGQGGEADCAVPAGATAVIVSLTAVSPQGTGNLRLSAAGVTPFGGVVNYAANGLNNSNTVTVPLSPGGQVDIAANAAGTDVRLVVVAYYAPAVAPGLGYVPLIPCAVADSRTGQNPSGTFVGPFAPGAPYPDVDVVGTFNTVGDNQGGNNTTCGVPAGADAVMINVVSVQGTGGSGGLAVGTGGTEPTETTTNFAAIGLNNAASMVVALDGGETIATNILGDLGSTTHVRIVVLGYFETATGAQYQPLNPCAIFDTRPTQGAAAGFLGPRLSGAATTYEITGSPANAQGGTAAGCAVPDGASAVLINLVSIQPSQVGNLRAFATGSTPTGGVLNFASLSPAANNSNAVVVPLDASGKIDVFVNTSTNNGTATTEIRGVVLGYYN